MWQKKDPSAKKDKSKERLNLQNPQQADVLSLKEPHKYLGNSPQTLHSSHVGLSQKLGQGKSRTDMATPQIVVYHESQTAAEDGDWMSKLKEDSAQFLAEQRGVQLRQIYKESLYKQGLESLIDKIYGLMQRYSFEFNQVAGGTDLHVSGTISGDVTEVTRYSRLREVEETQTYFRARFSTRLLSLVLRGRDDKVEFYVLPTNKVMALSKYENEFRPIAAIQVKVTEQGMMWRMQGGVPAVDSLDELSMWLFTNLIQESKRATKDEGDPGE